MTLGGGVRAWVIGFALLLSCSSLNRERPNVTCADLAFGAKNACSDGIIASCLDGQRVQYEACQGKDGETACDASWNKQGSYRCRQTDTPKVGPGRSQTPAPSEPEPTIGGAGGAPAPTEPAPTASGAGGVPAPPPASCLTQACTSPSTCPSAACDCNAGSGVATSCADGCCVTDTAQLCAQLCAAKGGLALAVAATVVGLPTSDAAGATTGCLHVSGAGNERYVARASSNAWGVLGWSDAFPAIKGACLGSSSLPSPASLPSSCVTATPLGGPLYFVSPGSGVWRSSDLCFADAKHERVAKTEAATSVAVNTDGVWVALGTRLGRLVTTPGLAMGDSFLEVDVFWGAVGGGSTVEPLVTTASADTNKVRLLYPAKQQEKTLQLPSGSVVRSVAIASSGVFVTTDDPPSGGNRLSVYDLTLLTRKKSYLLEKGVCEGGVGAMSVNVGSSRTVALCRRGAEVVELVLP